MESQLFTLRSIPPDPQTDAPGLTLYEAFTRMMALSGRSYRFSRTNWTTHLDMTNRPESAPDFISSNTNPFMARMEIVEQVCRHGLGEFQVIADEEYYRGLRLAGRAA